MKGFIIQVEERVYFVSAVRKELVTSSNEREAWFTADFHVALEMANSLSHFFGQAFCPVEFEYID